MCARTGGWSPISNRTIGIHVFDKGSDGVTDLSEPDAFYIALPFQTGMDIYMPAAPPDGAVAWARPRPLASAICMISRYSLCVASREARPLRVSTMVEISTSMPSVQKRTMFTSAHLSCVISHMSYVTCHM